jgi:hypothetical protein
MNKFTGSIYGRDWPMSKRKEMTLWYLEPIGAYTNETLAKMIPEFRFYQGLTCWDKVPRNLVAVTHAEIEGFEESRKNDSNLHFSVWYKDGQSGEIKLSKSDDAYTHPRTDRKVRKLIRTGDGKPVRVLHRRVVPLP